VRKKKNKKNRRVRMGHGGYIVKGGIELGLGLEGVGECTGNPNLHIIVIVTSSSSSPSSSAEIDLHYQHCTTVSIIAQEHNTCNIPHRKYGIVIDKSDVNYLLFEIIGIFVQV